MGLAPNPAPVASRGVNCPDCGRFSAQPWGVDHVSIDKGPWFEWGGVCPVHGRWSDST